LACIAARESNNANTRPQAGRDIGRHIAKVSPESDHWASV
jgi:hypothetical protein